MTTRSVINAATTLAEMGDGPVPYLTRDALAGDAGQGAVARDLLIALAVGLRARRAEAGVSTRADPQVFCKPKTDRRGTP